VCSSDLKLGQDIRPRRFHRRADCFPCEIGCLLESATGVSDLANQQRTLYFAHNALMTYAIDETKCGILSMGDIDRYAFSKSLEQAAEGSLHENIVYTHHLLSANKNGKVFPCPQYFTRILHAPAFRIYLRRLS
jgi:hypothetical protein